jgi:predicted PurR-regulated permease PerM
MLVGICATILVIFLLYQMRPVFAPLAFSFLVIAVVWPIQRELQTRVPKLIALAVSALVTFFIVTVFVSIVVWGFGRVGRYVVTEAAHFQALYGHAVGWLEQHGIVVASLWAEHFSMSWLIRLFQQVLSAINGTLSFSLVVLIYVVLGLLEVDDAARRLAAMKNQEVGRILLAGITETAEKLRRYMAVRSLMSLATGILVWGFASVTGLELAVEWGVIAFALNYIPFIGPFIATMFPTLFAVAQFQSWEMVVIVFACLNLIQFLVGSYLEPRIAGSTLAISPFVVLFSVFFWTSLWGLAGTFIGVPITIAVLTISKHSSSARWLTELFGESSSQAGQLKG